MENQSDTILVTETITNQSKGILPNLPKGKYIPYSVDEMSLMVEKSRFDFAVWIEENGWLNYLYSGDWEHNARLQFIRLWYYKDWRKTKITKTKENTHQKGQLKLL